MKNKLTIFLSVVLGLTVAGVVFAQEAMKAEATTNTEMNQVSNEEANETANQETNEMNETNATPVVNAEAVPAAAPSGY